MKDIRDAVLSALCTLGWIIVIVLLLFIVINHNYTLSTAMGAITIITIVLQIILSISRKIELDKLTENYNELQTRYEKLYDKFLQDVETLKTTDGIKPAQISIKVGDTWTGKTYTDLINQVLRTKYTDYNKSTVLLENGDVKISAWFIFMDGTSHGNNDKYLWQNRLSEDGKTIVERCVSDDKTYARSIAPCQQEAFAFQLDPNGEGNKNCCKFVGKFKMVDNDEENMIRVYTKIADSFKLYTNKSSIVDNKTDDASTL